MSFTPAFEEKRFGTACIKRSQATKGLGSGFKIGESDQYVSVGHKYRTQSVTLRISLSDVETVVGTSDAEHHQALLVGCILSLVWGLKRAISIAANSELKDFDVDWTADQNDLILFIYDTTEGGNGIARSVSELLHDKSNPIGRILFSITQQTCCKKICLDCLLLPGTPEHYVRADYLRKEYLAKWVQSK